MTQLRNDAERDPAGNVMMFTCYANTINSTFVDNLCAWKVGWVSIVRGNVDTFKDSSHLYARCQHPFVSFPQGSDFVAVYTSTVWQLPQKLLALRNFVPYYLHEKTINDEMVVNNTLIPML